MMILPEININNEFNANNLLESLIIEHPLVFAGSVISIVLIVAVVVVVLACRFLALKKQDELEVVHQKEIERLREINEYLLTENANKAKKIDDMREMIVGLNTRLQQRDEGEVD